MPMTATTSAAGAAHLSPTSAPGAGHDTLLIELDPAFSGAYRRPDLILPDPTLHCSSLPGYTCIRSFSFLHSTLPYPTLPYPFYST
eukprot:957572-Pyramimonas_sp.AAC.1